METMEREDRRTCRSFTPEFKADIVERCRAGDRTIVQVAEDFDLTVSAVRRWVAQAESFFATIKRELVDTRAWPTRAGLRAAVFAHTPIHRV